MTIRCRWDVLAVLVLALMALTVMVPGPALADLFGRAPAEEAPPAPAPDPAVEPLDSGALVAALPRVWHGTFIWDEGAAYFIELRIVSLSVRETGEVGFIAESRWSPGDLEARMSGRIDPETLRLRIWEVPADDSADGFDSDGQYDGVLANDLWDLRATWITGATGAAGSLVLVAKAMPSP